MKLDIEKFDPKVAELEKMAKETKKLVVSDLHNTSEVAVIKEKRIELGKVRRTIEDTGKALRADAIMFQKAVIKKEKELISIIEPEENRLKTIETDSKELLIREDREKLLPERCEKFRIAGITVGDNDLLNMDDNEYLAFYNEKLSEKLEADRIKAEEDKVEEEAKKERKAEIAQEKIDKQTRKIENEKRKIEEEKREIEYQKEILKVKESARLQAIKDEKIAKLQIEEKDKKAKLQAEKERKANKLYQDFLGKNRYNKETDKVKETDESYILYRIVATLKK